MNVNVIYEETIQISIEKAYELAMQWISSQYKAKIKKISPPTYIEAKQGTMMTNTGHDPNWKKRIRINLYKLETVKTLIRVDAAPLARNVFRVEKLKKSWFEGLFIHLFLLLHTAETSSIPIKAPRGEIRVLHCTNCGKKIDENTKICPMCGIDIN